MGNAKNIPSTVATTNANVNLNENLPPLVLVHGIKGSHLLDTSTGKFRFLTVASIFNVGPLQFPLPQEREDEGRGKQKTDTLVSAGIMEEIGPKWMPLKRPYGPFLDWAKSTGREVYTFHYDWRRELQEQTSGLATFLRKILEGKTTGAQVVAHSMGGLITFPLLNESPELFHSVLFGASALGGGVSFLPDLSIPGKDNMLGPFNSSTLTPKHWLGWPSGFHFFNNVGERETSEGTFCSGLYDIKETGEEIDTVCDFHNIDDWKRLKIGPYHPSSGCEMNPSAEVFFAETLARAKEFRHKIMFDEKVTYPPIAVIASDYAETVIAWGKQEHEGIFLFDGTKSKKTPGDLRVALCDAFPPEGVPVCKHIVNKATHMNVLNDIPSVSCLLTTLIEQVNQ